MTNQYVLSLIKLQITSKPDFQLVKKQHFYLKSTTFKQYSIRVENNLVLLKYLTFCDWRITSCLANAVLSVLLTLKR